MEIMLPSALRQSWITLGQWYKNPDNPDQWLTPDQTSFVSGYGHRKGPNEDFAETMCYYIRNPEKLQTRALKKYNWIKENAMGGKIHFETVAQKAFEVLNLDDESFIYPGRIRKVLVRVLGGPSEDKVAEVNFILFSRKNTGKCAEKIFFRLQSDLDTFMDIYAHPKDGVKCGYHLIANINLNKNTRSGIWTTSQLTVSGTSGLERHIGMADFGLRIWVNNALEDFQKPIYVPGSAQLALKSISDDIYLRTTFLIKEEGSLAHCSSYVSRVAGGAYSWHAGTGNEGPPYSSSQNENWREMEGWDGIRKVPLEQCFEEEPTDKDKKAWSCYQAATMKKLSPYIRGAEYTLRRLVAKDKARNTMRKEFHNESITINIPERDPDITPPTIHHVNISAVPTNAEMLDGETTVTINLSITDDKSGLDIVGYRLRDPYGTEHGRFFRVTGVSLLFLSKKDVLQVIPKYEILSSEDGHLEATTLLPRGSTPGTWFLEKVEAYDKVGNHVRAQYFETVLIANEEV
ncbi:sporozoite invasion-associated protein 1 [Cardiosporidium cionae]|uniref:Sporozoite invasion-associated protein 1 n=1 Tax=Cardiosporidium cionae TaxID=476202 RepID=A0ABQ7J4L1_9APIC|nr:sporozoite invasion-associated protein 1 [Cardiosporidium cionae]|eukprot:KAF8818372.1 sporozoite invasion-associated protein 1 [Cardiosporidium cionae]